MEIATNGDEMKDSTNQLYVVHEDGADPFVARGRRGIENAVIDLYGQQVKFGHYHQHQQSRVITLYFYQEGIEQKIVALPINEIYE